MVGGRRSVEGGGATDGKRLSGVVCLLAAMAVGGVAESAAPKAGPEAPLTEAGERLLERYAGMLEALRAEIEKALPIVDQRKTAQFVPTWTRRCPATGRTRSSSGGFLRG